MPALARNIKITLADFLWMSVILVFACFGAQSAFANDFSASIQISKTNYLIGDVANLRLILRSEAEVSYSIPDLHTYLVGADNLKVTKKDSTSGGDVIQIVDYAFTCFDNKTFVIPEISISYEKQGYASPFIYKCAGVSVAFAMMRVDTSRGMRDIHGGVPIDSAPSSFSFWYILAGAVAILIFVIWRIVRNWRKVQREKCPQKELLRKLEKLKKQKLDPSSVAVSVSNLAKEFIVVFYHIKAFELSTDETLIAMNKVVNSTQSSRMKVVLGLADRVKFGKYAASDHDADTSYEMCREFAMAIIRESANA